jgi:hypothetical protein
MILVGQVLKGYCGGYFGSRSYGAKRVEAVGIDWIVARDVESGEVVAATDSDIHNIVEGYQIRRLNLNTQGG